MDSRPTAVVYVDGFNLYRRCLEGRNGVKWLDIRKLCESILPDFNLVGIEYFSANLRQAVTLDSAAISRQQIYFRALRTLSPFLEIRLGKFRADKRYLPVVPVQVDGDTGELVRAAVLKIEEKGSDVHLAARMVADSLTGRCDYVVLLSNDSDHAPQIEMLTNEFDRKVGLILPYLESKRSSKQLRNLKVEFARTIPLELLVASQFGHEMQDETGTFKMPACWA